MLLSLYKLFTSGYTKGNSAALIVAEGKFIQKKKSTARPLLQTYANPSLYHMVRSICEQAHDWVQNTRKWRGVWVFCRVSCGCLPAFASAPNLFCSKAHKRKSLRSSVDPDGQSEIKRDIKCLVKERESIYFDKDQICFS